MMSRPAVVASIFLCALMSSSTSAVIKDDTYEVVPEFSDGFACDGPLQNVDFYGNDLFHFKGDADACKKACKDTDACGAFTAAYGQCYIKTDVSSKVTSTRGCSSYICHRQPSS